jgi:hypothetical protein
MKIKYQKRVVCINLDIYVLIYNNIAMKKELSFLVHAIKNVDILLSQ